MSLSAMRDFLGWCTLINVGFLLFWFGMFAVAHGWVYRLHSSWFRISVERFDAAHYAGMTYFKLGIFLLNLTPWLALTLVDRAG